MADSISPHIEAILEAAGRLRRGPLFRPEGVGDPSEHEAAGIAAAALSEIADALSILQRRIAQLEQPGPGEVPPITARSE